MNKSSTAHAIFSKLTIFVFVIMCATSFLNGVQVVSAQGSDNIPIDNIPGSSEDNALITCGNGDENSRACGLSDLIGLVQNGLKLVFALAAFIATAMFIYAGFLMLTAVGNMNQINKAKTIFTRSIVGFLIMFVSFLLVQNLLQNIKLNADAKKVINNVIELQ